MGEHLTQRRERPVAEHLGERQLEDGSDAEGQRERGRVLPPFENMVTTGWRSRSPATPAAHDTRACRQRASMGQRDRPAPFTVIPPTAQPSPVVVHVPHSATALPADVRAQLLLSDAELAEAMEAVGMGAAYNRTSQGRPLRDLRQEQRTDLLDRLSHPYHAPRWTSAPTPTTLLRGCGTWSSNS